MRKFSTHTQTEQAKRLRESGLSYRQIASRLGIDHSIAYRMCTIPGYPNKTGNKGIDVEKAIELRKAGMSCIRIAEKLGCTRAAIYQNTSSVLTKEDKVKQKVKPVQKFLRMPRKKKKVDAPQPMVDRYANLQKGLEKGVKEIVTTVRSDRDEGYTNAFSYRDEYSVKKATIFVKDGASREESAARWCKKFNKTFVNLI